MVFSLNFFLFLDNENNITQNMLIKHVIFTYNNSDVKTWMKKVLLHTQRVIDLAIGKKLGTRK